MATVTIRPDADIGNIGAPPLTGGATYTAVTADDVDTSYANLAFTNQHFRVSLANPSLPAGAIIQSVTPRIRHNSTFVNARKWFALAVQESGLEFAREPFGAGGVTTQTGVTRTTQPDGSPWTVSALNSLSFAATNSGTTDTAVAVYAMYVDVVYSVAPTVTGNALGTVATAKPSVTWSYSDGDSEPQESYRVKVFSAAEYNAGGFDPNTSTPTYDSGVVYSSATFHTVAQYLLNGTTYRAFIWATDTGGRTNTVTTAGPYGSVTIGITAPTAPTIVATTQASSIRLVITANNNIAPVSFYGYSVEKNIDGVWTELTRLWSALGNGRVDYLNMDLSLGGANPQLTVNDYEVRRGTFPQYRARVKAIKSGNSLVSPYSATAIPVTALPTTGWRLTPINSPTGAIAINVHNESVTWESKSRQSALYALGRSKPIILSDVIGGESLNVQLAMLTQADYDYFEQVRGWNDTMLLQTSYGDHRYVRFGEQRNATHVLTGGGDRKYLVAVELIEVDP